MATNDDLINDIFGEGNNYVATREQLKKLTKNAREDEKQVYKIWQDKASQIDSKQKKKIAELEELLIEYVNVWDEMTPLDEERFVDRVKKALKKEVED